VGLLDAVAARDSHWGPGESVRLSVDAARIARVGADLTRP
jgi:hypothetical protein